MITRLLKKITAWLVAQGIDTYLHILATMFVAWVVTAVLTVFQLAEVFYLERPLSGLIGLIVAIVVGVVKERLDEKSGSGLSTHDLNCDFIGGAFFYLIYVLL